jgi:hypothetical protein
MFERLFERLLGFEHKTERIISWRQFLHRLGYNLVWAAILITGSLAIGITGYVYIFEVVWT